MIIVSVTLTPICLQVFLLHNCPMSVFPVKEQDNNDPYDDIPANVTENDNSSALASAGVQLGLYVGAGIQIFVTKNIALDLFLRNYIFEDNPTGFDLNNDLSVTVEDNQYYQHLFTGIGLSILLPQNDS